LKIARLSIEKKLDNNDYVPDFTNLSDECFDKYGLFVVLIEDNYLRSIAGITDSSQELYKTCQKSAINAAFYNSKSKKVSKEDMNKIIIEISILTDLKKLNYKDPDDLLNKINSKMGLVLKDGLHKQVFLPTMWRMYPDKQDFMDRFCFEAGLQEATWRRKHLNLFKFTTETFAEDDKI